MTGRSSSTDEPSDGRGSGRVLLLAVLALALVAAAVLVFSENARWLRLGIVAALWAALVGAFLAAKYRRQVAAREDEVADLQSVYELELEREINARREYELEVEAATRRAMDEESREDLDALRAELHALRESLEALLGGEVLVERVALRAESTRMRSLSDQSRLVAMGDDRIIARTDDRRRGITAGPASATGQPQAKRTPAKSTPTRTTSTRSTPAKAAPAKGAPTTGTTGARTGTTPVGAKNTPAKSGPDKPPAGREQAVERTELIEVGPAEVPVRPEQSRAEQPRREQGRPEPKRPEPARREPQGPPPPRQQPTVVVPRAAVGQQPDQQRAEDAATRTDMPTVERGRGAPAAARAESSELTRRLDPERAARDGGQRPPAAPAAQAMPGPRDRTGAPAERPPYGGPTEWPKPVDDLDPPARRHRPDVGRVAEVRPGESRSGEFRTGEPRSGEYRTGDPRSGEFRTGDPRSGEFRAGEPRRGDTRAAEPRPGEPRTRDARAVEPRAVEPRGGERRGAELDRGRPQPSGQYAQRDPRESRQAPGTRPSLGSRRAASRGVGPHRTSRRVPGRPRAVDTGPPRTTPQRGTRSAGPAPRTPTTHLAAGRPNPLRTTRGQAGRVRTPRASRSVSCWPPTATPSRDAVVAAAPTTDCARAWLGTCLVGHLPGWAGAWLDRGPARRDGPRWCADRIERCGAGGDCCAGEGCVPVGNGAGDRCGARAGATCRCRQPPRRTSPARPAVGRPGFRATARTAPGCC